MLFKEVIGQEEIKQRLIRTVRENRISHAQLFFGPPGVGKLPLAIAYAQYISCLNRGEEDSCGSCISCQKFAKLVHPDLHFVFPVFTTLEVKSQPVSDNYIAEWRGAMTDNPYLTENKWYEIIGAENKQGLISKYESSAVQRKLSLKSYEGEYKILIMWLAEKMNGPAANTLLKLIEEPPPKTLFLLVSENTDLIISTILSRTQMIRIMPIDKESIAEALRNRYPDAGELIEDVIRRSNGNYSTALQLIESDELDNRHFDEFTSLMRKCYKREIIEITAWVDLMAAWGREGLKQFLAYGLRMIRENFILNLKQREVSFLSKKEEDFSNRFSVFIHEGNVFGLAAEFERAIAHIEANGYAKLVLFDLAIKTIMLLKAPPAES